MTTNIKSIFARFLPAGLFGRSVVGYVEAINYFEIRGWVLNRRPQPLELTLVVDGTVFPLVPEWSERADVAQAHGERFLLSGYTCGISGRAREALQRAAHRRVSPQVLADGQPLDMLDRLPAPPAEVAFEPLEENRVAVPGPLVLKEWGHFVIRGTFSGTGDPGRHIQLEMGGRVVDGVSVLAKAAPGEAVPPQLDVQIELPGYLWEDLPADESLAVQVLVDATPVLETPLRLTVAKAAGWVRNIALGEDGADRQYFALLALEHIRYGRLLPRLDRASREFVLDFARKMRLDGYLEAEPGGFAVAPNVPADNPSERLHWLAMRSLNERLLKVAEGAIFPHVKAVHDDCQLVGDVKQLYVKSVLPLLCRADELPRLRDLVSFQTLHQLEHADNEWGLSLAVPVLVADRLIQRASDTLWRLAGTRKGSWFNTECLRYAVAEVQRLEAAGEIDAVSAETFRYAYLGVLAAFEGGWFRRLHDRELIDGVLCLLQDLERYTDYHRNDVVRAAMHHFGLCPDFWLGFEGMRASLPDPVLHQARSAWLGLRAMLEGDSSALAARLDELRSHLEFFHRQGNPEAISFLREVVTHCLPELNRNMSAEGRALISWLYAEDTAEAIRLAAFPAGEDGFAREHLPAGLAATLRQLTVTKEHPASPVYGLQQTAARVLGRARRAAEIGDRELLVDALQSLETIANALLNWPGMFLGCDALASAYVLARRTGVNALPYLIRWGEAVRSAVRETAPDDYLAAPVLASLGRFANQAGDVMGRQLAADLRAEIAGKFGSKQDAMFQAPGRSAPDDAESGWPADTLVVVYSCRKYLDSRIPALRDTWLQDVKARGIPYLVLVGDGDDRIEGDVLALAVSDKYEDLPKKTLALFRWAVRNTDFQYVLKIDDDCYLDVDRYFDTLSYRRHAYYGRVIRRQVGSMDRVWHQEKSHTSHAQKTLDKSPEPSTYADGGGGYTLSRLAMVKLLEMAMTEAGQRLQACSVMEDKLVGDLLSLANITPSNEDYESYQRRRTFATALPVGMWENTFFPSEDAPTVMVHLDSERDLVRAHRHCAAPGLWPKKLWPTHRSVLLDMKWEPPGMVGSNQLELISDAAKVALLLAEGVVVVSVVRNEMVMLPHFLAHYRGLGVDCFVMVDNLSDDGTREFLIEQPDVVLFSADTEYRYSHYGVAWQQAVLGNLCLGKWVLLADADELLVFPDCEHRDLNAFVAELQSAGVDCVRTDMIDMYPSGDLGEADFTKQAPFEAAPMFDRQPLRRWCLGSGWFSNSASWSSALRHRIDSNAEPSAFVAQKYALLRYQPWIRFSEGLHYVSGAQKIAQAPVWFAHFKYHAGFQRKVETEIRRGQHFDNAREYRRYAAMLAESRGSFGDPRLSQHYTDSHSFAEIDYQGDK